MKMRDRSGFTLVELMIVAVVGAMVVGATYQILLSSQRAYTIQSAQIQGRQTVRAGLDILFAELRELSRAEGDILTMGPDHTHAVEALGGRGKVCMLSAFCERDEDRAGLGVLDPFGGDARAYRECLETLEGLVEAALGRVDTDFLDAKNEAAP